MFSEALIQMDKNTVQYMIEEQQKTIKENQKTIKENQKIIEEQVAQIARLEKALREKTKEKRIETRT